jgi:tRNA uridine 5-carbamoylmethylation protein Kti12
MENVVIMYIFVGLPASGKTTFSNSMLRHYHVLISLDVFKSRKVEKHKLVECIEMSKECIIDNTNITKGERASYISTAKAAGYRIIGYYFSSTVKEAIVRNRQREKVKRVPDVAIFSIAKRLEPPTKNEGFDELFSVQPDGKGGVIIEDLG